MSRLRNQVSCVQVSFALPRRQRAGTNLFSTVLSRCELGFVQAGGDICECSQQRSVPDGSRRSCQELQVTVCSASMWVNNKRLFPRILKYSCVFPRPQILAMTGAVRSRPALLDLAHSISKSYGLCLTCDIFVVGYTEMSLLADAKRLKQSRQHRSSSLNKLIKLNINLLPKSRFAHQANLNNLTCSGHSSRGEENSNCLDIRD